MTRTPLTWKNVSAPDFSSASNILSNATQQFNNAGKSIMGAFEGLDKSQQEQANNIMAQRMLALTGDIGAQEELIRSGNIFTDIAPRMQNAAKVQSMLSNAAEYGKKQIEAKDSQLDYDTKSRNSALSVEADELMRSMNPELLASLSTIGGEEGAPGVIKSLQGSGYDGRQISLLMPKIGSQFTSNMNWEEPLHSLNNNRTKEVNTKHLSTLLNGLVNLPDDAKRVEAFSRFEATHANNPDLLLAAKAAVGEKYPDVVAPLPVDASTVINQFDIPSPGGNKYTFTAKAGSEGMFDFSKEHVPSIKNQNAMYQLGKYPSSGGGEDVPINGPIPTSLDTSKYSVKDIDKVFSNFGYRSPMYDGIQTPAFGPYQFKKGTFNSVAKKLIDEGELSPDDKVDSKIIDKVGKRLYTDSVSGDITKIWPPLAGIIDEDTGESIKGTNSALNGIPWEVVRRYIEYGEHNGGAEALNGLTIQQLRRDAIVYKASQEDRYKQEIDNQSRLIREARPKLRDVDRLAYGGYGGGLVAGMMMADPSIIGAQNNKNEKNIQQNIESNAAITSAQKALNKVSTDLSLSPEQQRKYNLTKAAEMKPAEASTYMQRTLADIQPIIGAQANIPALLADAAHTRNYAQAAALTGSDPKLLEGISGALATAMKTNDYTSIAPLLGIKSENAGNLGQTISMITSRINKHNQKVESSGKGVKIPTSSDIIGYLLSTNITTNWGLLPDFASRTNQIADGVGIDFSKVNTAIENMGMSQVTAASFKEQKAIADRMKQLRDNVNALYLPYSTPAGMAKLSKQDPVVRDKNFKAAQKDLAEFIELSTRFTNLGKKS